MKDEFNYRQYLAESFLFKEAGAGPVNWKKAYLQAVASNSDTGDYGEEPLYRLAVKLVSQFTGNFEEDIDFLQNAAEEHSDELMNQLGEDNLPEVKREPKQATTADLKGYAGKNATLNREKRTQQGNWEGSVGKYVEDHRAEIDAAAQHNALRAYMVATMRPALNPEAQEYLDKLLTGYASSRQLHQALYNILLKGRGLGLHEGGI